MPPVEPRACFSFLPRCRAATVSRPFPRLGSIVVPLDGLNVVSESLLLVFPVRIDDAIQLGCGFTILVQVLGDLNGGELDAELIAPFEHLGELL